MLTNELSELAMVVERIRSESQPDLNKGLIDAILKAEADAAGNDGVALQAIRAAVTSALKTDAD